MHRVFGVKQDAAYYDRAGAYLIPIREHRVGIVQTPKGYFFLGGGLEGDEGDLACIQRECLEEAGYQPRVGEKLCTAETYTTHPRVGYFHPIQTYYLGELGEKVAEPVEKDHRFLWVDADWLRGKLFADMQNWALEQALLALAHA